MPTLTRSTALSCPECGGLLRVYTTKYNSNSNTAERRRECKECDLRFVTEEYILRSADVTAMRERGTMGIDQALVIATLMFDFFLEDKKDWVKSLGFDIDEFWKARIAVKRHAKKIGGSHE